jgi:DMSO reductase family type II enzyme chaperone
VSAAEPAAGAETRRDRDAGWRRAATARSAGFALFSRLTASPFEAGATAIPDDLTETLVELGDALPYATAFAPLAEAGAGALEADTESWADEYAALFEVGTSPLPIREETARPEAERAGAKEELVRFYDLFGYRLSPERQWAPDHLSVALEFLHLLAFRESHAVSFEAAAPFARAQRDFLGRHVQSWLPQLAQAVSTRAKGLYAQALFTTLADWLSRDLAWRRASLPAEDAA